MYYLLISGHHLHLRPYHLVYRSFVADIHSSVVTRPCRPSSHVSSCFCFPFLEAYVPHFNHKFVLLNTYSSPRKYENTEENTNPCTMFSAGSRFIIFSSCQLFLSVIIIYFYFPCVSLTFPYFSLFICFLSPSFSIILFDTQLPEFTQFGFFLCCICSCSVIPYPIIPNIARCIMEEASRYNMIFEFII